MASSQFLVYLIAIIFIVALFCLITGILRQI